MHLLRPDSPSELQECLARLRRAGQDLAQLPLATLLAHLEALGRLWQPGSAYYRQACSLLAGTFCQRAVEAALGNLAFSLNAKVLAAEVQRELGRSDLLDAWLPDESGTGLTRGFPLGVVAHVLAGNVFLGGVVALAQSLLTRNAVLLKLSREDSGFTQLFVQSLAEAAGDGALARAVAVAAWSSEQDDQNQVLRAEADALVVWGGQAAIAAYPTERCRGKVIHYGPRLGIGFVLDGVDLDRAAPALAWDVALWEQRACSSPRLLFVEDADGSGALPRRTAQRLSAALTSIRDDLKPRPLALDDKSEVLSIRELAYWGNRTEVHAPPGSMDHTVLLGSEPPHDVPIGYRTVTIVPLGSLAQVPELLAPYRMGLQTAVLAAPAPRWPEAAAVLARAGITQVAAAGSAASRFLGLPHEGEFALRRLVTLVGIDLGAGALAYPGRDPAEAAAIVAALASRQ
jgi:phenylacetate-CoA ligase